MSNECQRKFGVERITSYDDFHNVICKDCGERYGRHVGITCPPVKERAKRSPVERGVISDVAILEVINTAIGTATSIINMSDNKHVQDMAANIADSLIALTDVESL